MKLYPYLFILLILAGNASAECKEKECMTTEYKFQQDGGTWHTFYYNEVFNIGTNWSIIFDCPKKQTLLSLFKKKKLFLIIFNINF